MSDTLDTQPIAMKDALNEALNEALNAGVCDTDQLLSVVKKFEAACVGLAAWLDTISEPVVVA